HPHRARHGLGRPRFRGALRRSRTLRPGRRSRRSGGHAMRVGIVGCGVIVAQYLATFDALPDVELVAVADLDPSRARAIADGREGVRALAVDELLADPEVDTVLNLTIPAAHPVIDLKAIAEGKHVYSEQ